MAAGSSGYAPPVQEGERMTVDTSVDTDTTLALMSYNIGIQNNEVNDGVKAPKRCQISVHP